MGAYVAEPSVETTDPEPIVTIRFDWSISHTAAPTLGHGRELSAVLNAANGPQYSPATVQASFLLLATLMSVVTVATVASCWGWLRKGKRKELRPVRLAFLLGCDACCRDMGAAPTRVVSLHGFVFALLTHGLKSAHHICS